VAVLAVVEERLVDFGIYPRPPPNASCCLPEYFSTIPVLSMLSAPTFCSFSHSRFLVGERARESVDSLSPEAEELADVRFRIVDSDRVCILWYIDIVPSTERVTSISANWRDYYEF
jgi:hypothetical protein